MLLYTRMEVCVLLYMRWECGCVAAHEVGLLYMRREGDVLLYMRREVGCAVAHEAVGVCADVQKEGGGVCCCA